ncbi:cation-transporting P-type ATPase [Burkholderia gladioli]|nr:cation-transporting P-type ATPase [Burkholderia gladioli]
MTLRFLRRKRQRGFVQPGARERAASPATAPIVAEASRSLEDVLARLHTGTRGLTFSQAEDRLAQHGANEIAHDRPPHWLRQLLHAFHNPFVYVLPVPRPTCRPPRRACRISPPAAPRRSARPG